jgi:hypothetical protein
MIKKVLCSLSLLGLFGLNATAQKSTPCGTDEIQQQLMKTYPQIAEKNAQLSVEISNKLSKMTAKDLLPFAKTTDDGSVIYDVPLVFHIIHDYGAEYLPDDSVYNCVKDLNKIFNKQNWDTIQATAPFKGVINNSNKRYIGKGNIVWHLATIDPNGNPTNGVTRRRNYLTKAAGDLAKFDQWPSNNYMNIWIINAFIPRTGGFAPAAYAYKPATGDAIPYYDGVITLYNYINRDNTIGHELGHELNLDHPWGGTNSPEVACGDDEVDDTPLTKGHASCYAADLYDTACLYNYRKPIAKQKLDSLKRADGTLLLSSDTATDKGIVFKNRTATLIESFGFYPSAAVGSTYRIGLKRNNVIIDSFNVISITKDTLQTVTRKISVPPADTATNYMLFFMQNPGAWKDSVNATGYSRGFNGTILIKKTADDAYYNFFYDWKITYGYYKIYAPDSLVDYPDTTNTQNVMDYSYCSKMFTAGQVDRMRAALTSTVAKRSSLITPENLAKTGALASLPALKPKAEYSVEKGVTISGVSVMGADPSYFMCADNGDLNYNFRFTDRSWQAPANTKQWILSNAATNTTPVGLSLSTRFATPGWASVKLVAGNVNGTDTFETMPSVYVADPTAINPIGFWQEFTDEAENAKWPIFNYYNNRYKWEIANVGTYDGKSIRYRTYDDRRFPDNLYGEAAGDYDDFFTPAFDLSVLPVDGNLNFMYAGAYATNNPDLMKDVLEIAYSTSCGANWTILKTMKDAQMQTVGSVPSVLEYTPAWNDWKPMSIDLKNGATAIRNNKVFFRFRYKPSSRPLGQYSYAAGNNFYIDRINISNYPLTVNEMILGDKKVAIAPNPANGTSFVLFQKANANVTIQVLDMTGKLVYSIQTKVDQNNARVAIPVTELGAKGVYLVRITGDDNLNQTEKLVVY